MKKLLIYISSIILLIFILDRSGSFVLGKLYEQNYTGLSGGKFNAVLNKERVGTLLVGNSRCGNNIDPDNFRYSSYNLSHHGMSLTFHAGALDVILSDTSVDVDTVVLNIEINEWFHHEGNYSDEIQYLKYYYGSNTYITSAIDQISFFEPLKFIFDSYRYNGRILSTIKNYDPKAYDPNSGYTPLAPSPSDSEMVFKSAAHFFQFIPPDTLMLNERHIHRLQHLKMLCDSLDVKLITYIAPIYAQAGAPKDANKEEIEMLEEFFNSQGIPLINYTQNPRYLGLNSPGDWHDAMHLNHNGAVKFSKVLAKDLKKLKFPKSK